VKKINNKLFKKVLGKFATGITVISIYSNGTKIGKTVNSFSALSLSPPLILFALDKKASSLNLFKKTNFLSVNILGSKQSDISKIFAKKDAKWKKVSFTFSKHDTPIINNCLANLECRKIKILKEGDHMIFICKVINASFDDTIKPLLYFNSSYN